MILAESERRVIDAVMTSNLANGHQQMQNLGVVSGNLLKHNTGAWIKHNNSGVRLFSMDKGASNGPTPDEQLPGEPLGADEK